MNARPRFIEIVDWYDGQADEATGAKVQRSIDARDPRTVRTVRWLQTFENVAAAMPLEEPPPIVRQNLRQAFADWSRKEGAKGRPQRSVEAALVFDSRQGLARTGTRSAAGDDAVHLAFEGDEVDVLLDLTPTGDGMVRVEGQVLPADDDVDAVFEAIVEADGETYRTVDGDEWGRFTFDAVPDAITGLVAENTDLRIALSWSRA